MPCNIIDNFISFLLKCHTNRINIMKSPRYKYRSRLFLNAKAFMNPLSVEAMHIINIFLNIPVALSYGYHFTAVTRDPSVD